MRDFSFRNPALIQFNMQRNATSGKKKTWHFLELPLTKYENDSYPFPVNISTSFLSTDFTCFRKPAKAIIISSLHG